MCGTEAACGQTTSDGPILRGSTRSKIVLTDDALNLAIQQGAYESRTAGTSGISDPYSPRIAAHLDLKIGGHIIHDSTGRR